MRGVGLPDLERPTPEIRRLSAAGTDTDSRPWQGAVVEIRPEPADDDNPADDNPADGDPADDDSRPPTSVEVCRGDITAVEVDAIVNAANSSLMGGGGVDGAIHRAGGPEILDACRKVVAALGPCRAGDAVITGGGRLPARWVIHTVGPVWTGEDPDGQATVLASCYTASLDLAAAHEVRTIAFPNISTGVYGYPKSRAASAAVNAVRGWVEHHPFELDLILFVCFDAENEQLYRELLA